MHGRISRWIVRIERFTDRIWYLPLVALLAGLDLFLFVIPVDGLLISTVMLRPKRWVSSFLWFSFGSSVGALAMGFAVHVYGGIVLERLVGKAISPELWQTTESLVIQHGFWAMALVSGGPLPLPPAVVIAAVAGMPLPMIFLSVWIGRVVKYGFFAWASTHAPGLLARFRRVKKEVTEIEAAEAEERVRSRE